jgi:C-terminal processing protease CtpA/Prc
MVSENLSGPPGSKVKITILREGAGRMTFELERRVTDVQLARKVETAPILGDP